MTSEDRRGVASPGHADLVEMWRALLKGGWDLLAVVPADHAVSIQPVLDALGDAAGSVPAGLRTLDARGYGVDQCRHVAQGLSGTKGGGERVVVFVDSMMRSLGPVHVVQQADAAVLVIQAGRPDVEALRSTLDLVGPARILGSISAPAAP